MELEQEKDLPKEEGYKPRPAWQVWAARVGLVIFILIVIASYALMFKG